MADRDVALPSEAEVTPQRAELHDPTPVKPLDDEMLHLLRFAQFQQARVDQEAGSYLQAAERFETLVEEAPQIEIAPDALFNAAISYEKADEPSKAAACYEKIVLHYPASKHYADSLLA